MSYVSELNGNENKRDEQIGKYYQKYRTWFEVIKKMCVESCKVESSISEPVETDFNPDTDIEEYIQYLRDKNTYEWNNNHFLLENGLHVYINNTEMQILDEAFEPDKKQRKIALRDKGIVFYTGDGEEAPYSISYSENGYEIDCLLPTKGAVRRHNDIIGILETATFLAIFRGQEEPIELYENSIEFYDKILEMVIKSQQLSREEQGGVNHKSIAQLGIATKITPTEIGEGKSVVGPGKDTKGDEVKGEE